jgi:hypothetical protein
MAVAPCEQLFPPFVPIPYIITQYANFLQTQVEKLLAKDTVKNGKGSGYSTP